MREDGCGGVSKGLGVKNNLSLKIMSQFLFRLYVRGKKRSHYHCVIFCLFIKICSIHINFTQKKVLDWVSDTYGKMSASEISEFSHLEMAYKFTEPNEPIAYEYGKFFKKLPPRSLVDN